MMDAHQAWMAGTHHSRASEHLIPLSQEARLLQVSCVRSQTCLRQLHLSLSLYNLIS